MERAQFLPMKFLTIEAKVKINRAIILKFRFVNYTLLENNNNNKRSRVAKDEFHHKLRDAKQMLSHTESRS